MAIVPCANKSGFYPGLTPYVMPIKAVASAAERDDGWDLPATGILRGILPIVRTAEATGATKTVSVGLKSSESGGDADGFLKSINVASTGLKKPSVDEWGILCGRPQKENLHFLKALAAIADGDIVTGHVMPSWAGRIDSWLARVVDPASTADKLSTLNLELAGVDVGTVPSTCALTTATLDAVAKEVAASAVSGANTFAAGAALDIEAASTTAFVEGMIDIIVTCTRTDHFPFEPFDLASVTAKSLTFTLAGADFEELDMDVVFLVQHDPEAFRFAA